MATPQRCRIFCNDQAAEGYLFVQAVYMTTYKWRLFFKIAADGN